MLPECVAVPRDAADVASVVRAAADGGHPIVPRGAGSGMPGGNVGTGILVDLQALDRRMTFDRVPSVRVGASTIYGDLDRAALHHGWRLPPDPSSGAFCTIGGMIATNAAGPRSLRAGSIRRWVRGVQIVTGDAEVGWIRRAGSPTATHEPELSAVGRFWRDVAPNVTGSTDAILAAFPHTTKNSCGYALDAFLQSGDLVDLIVGSEGTLAFVTQVELALEACAGAEAAMLVGLRDIEPLGEIVRVLRHCAPSAIELVDRSLLQLGAARVPERLRDVEALLLLSLEGPDAAVVESMVRRAKSTMNRLAPIVEVGLTASERAALWGIRKAASPALAALPDTRRSLQIIEDGCVPVAQLGPYLTGVRRAAGELDVDIVAFGHAGDGHLHVNALIDTSRGDFVDVMMALYRRVSALVMELGGTPSGEHGDGRLRAPLVEPLYGASVVDLFRATKTAFDPAGLLNPGVILPEGPAFAADRLKVGPAAPSIPSAIARGLRTLERDGGWQTPKLELLTARERTRV